MLIYAIGDIHGHLDKLQEMHARIERDAAGRDYKIIHIGDMIDRGPDSKGVIEYLMKGGAEGKNWQVLLGNHDRLLTNFVRKKTIMDVDDGTYLDWLNPRMGGDTTLESFGFDLELNPFKYMDKIPEEMIVWLESLPLLIEHPKAIFVHAGISHRRPLTAQTEFDCLWIREDYLEHDQPFEKLVIHGHTIVEEVTHFGNRLDIDTGMGKNKKLSAIVIDNDEIFEVLDGDRKAVLPPEGWTLWGQKA